MDIRIVNDQIQNAIAFFTKETGIMDSLAVSFGDHQQCYAAWDGQDTSNHALFDLASVTKIFTGLCMMRLWEEGELNPYQRVTYYCPEFSRLGSVTVEQLMGFQVRLVTPERIDAQPDRDFALRCLREVYSVGAVVGRAYSDIPAMVLKYVIEEAAGMPFMQYIQSSILAPAGMENTFAQVPANRLSSCLLYGPEYRIEKENWICRDDIQRGIPHDPKAALLQGNTDDLCGHAGLFSTLEDMQKLAKALLSEKIISRNSLHCMAVNRTGRQRSDGSYTQYLGYCCYRKHPDQYFSEIPVAMSEEAFGIGGFTGNHFSVDPVTGRYTIFLGNRVRNRLTVLIPTPDKRLEDYGLQPDGVGKIRWTNGTLHPSSVNYVHQKDQHLHAVIDQILSDSF